MSSVNEATVLGNLGADPEVKTFNDGGKIVTLSVATSESWNDKQSGERQERTEWHRVVLRGGLANTAEKYLKKGSKVYIQGAMRTRKYTDSSNVERYVTEIIGLKLNMLDGAPTNNNQQQGQQGQQQQAQDKQGQQQQAQQQQGQQQQTDTSVDQFGEIDDQIPFDN